MSNEAITWAFKQDLPMTDKFVLVALADYADDEGMCYPSHKKTAKRTGASVATVKRATRRLQESGYLDVLPWKRENGSTTSNRYSLKVGVQIDPPVQADTQGGYLSDPGAQVTSDPPMNHQLDPSDKPTPGTADADAVLLLEDLAGDPFDDWWKLYPHKKSKQDAKDAYAKAIKKHKPVHLTKMLEAYIEGRKREERAGKFVAHWPNASTWLNQERWTDYTEAPMPTTVRYDPWSKEAYSA